MTKTLGKAKNIFYWPGMNSNIQKYISSCLICLKYSKNKIKEPLISHSTSDFPFFKVRLDIAEIGGKCFLIVIDYYSKCLEVLRLKQKYRSAVIAKLKEIFSRFCIPEILIVDNNPFNSLEYKKFTLNWEFKIINSSPNYSKSNVMAEEAVGIAKIFIKKSKHENQDLELYLLNYRNSPVAGLQYTLAQLLQSREIRSKLNVLQRKELFKLVVQNCMEKVNSKKENQALYYNKRIKDMRK